MPVFLFEIDTEDDIFCFGLHVEDMKQANEMLALMHTAEFVGELECPDTHWHQVDKKRLN